MGVKERREREKEALRDEILDAARELFVREGYENVSMRRIAEKIDYSPTTIYLYFKDKSELIFQLCEETFAKLNKTMQGLGKEQSDPIGNLRKVANAYVEFGIRHPNHYKVTFMLPHTFENIVLKDPNETMGMKAFDNLRCLIGECIRQGAFRQVEVEATSQAVWAAIHGITSLLISKPGFPWVERNKLIDAVVEPMIDGLRETRMRPVAVAKR